eukprot:1159341-Pelagomonas_calceolata.AAC.6
MRSPDEFMCHNSGLQVTFEWPLSGLCRLHFAEGGKSRRTALLKCDKMRVKCEFDKVRRLSH